MMIDYNNAAMLRQCAKYGCLDPYLTKDQQKEAHAKHLEEENKPLPIVPKVAYCDTTGKDKTHHIDLHCRKLVEFIATNHVSYSPRTSRKVILSLYRKPCEECVPNKKPQSS